MKNQWFKQARANSNKSFYRILGMRRSGNHAVINWVLGQLNGNAILLDNMQEHEPIGTPHKKLKAGLGKANLLVSHEGRQLTDYFLNYSEDQFGKAKEKYVLLILRDPYNWLASWFAWQDELGFNFREDLEFRNYTINLWKDYARLYLKWSNDTNGKENLTQKKVLVNYNQWTHSLEYRKQLATQLGLKFTDKGREKMSINGYGSSFDGMTYNGRASELRVLDRWRKFENDPEFQALFDNEIRELGEMIFPEVKPTF